MKTALFRLAVVATLALGLGVVSHAQITLNHVSPTGPTLIRGSVINEMIDRLNGDTAITTLKVEDIVSPSSGTPIEFNGSSSMICATATPATAVDAVFHIATRPMKLITASQVHRVAAGGTSVVQITKDTGTDVPGGGTNLLSAGFNLNATADTVQVGALVATAATVTFAAGDRLAFDFADAIQSSAGIAITACFAPM